MSRLIALVLVLLAGRACVAAEVTYPVAPTASALTFKAFKEGWFSSLGHDHTIAGRDFAGAIRFDAARVEASSVTFTVKTATLEVLDPSASAEDRAKVAKTLRGAEVLDVERFPEILFASTAVRVAERQPGGRLALEVTGDLTLHGATRPIAFKAFLDAPSAAGLEASGTIGLDGSAFGIEPYGAGLGAVKVKDHLELDFNIVARAHGEEERPR